MRTLTLLAFCGAAFLATSGGQDSDLAKLQGVWDLTTVEIDGKALSMDDLKESRLVVKGDAYLFRFRDTHLDFKITLDSSQTPKTIDMLVVEGPEKGNLYKGIYVLEGDKYKICRHIQPGQERPTAFGTHGDSGLMMNVYKREKT
ncbi:MAG TPA: TIGR03067 domain-containing protein [Gemmataceae bacterium]|nr:TIGR03067 domain-containing protein [Gemmataceae bacterium]